MNVIEGWGIEAIIIKLCMKNQRGLEITILANWMSLLFKQIISYLLFWFIKQETFYTILKIAYVRKKTGKNKNTKHKKPSTDFSSYGHFHHESKN